MNLKAYGEAINIGGEQERSVLQIANLILEFTGKQKSLIMYVPDRPGNVPRFVSSNEKIERMLKWKPTINFEDGLLKTVEWYRNNEWWWTPLVRE
jgi:dTDP-glucose 4,6-dehydratase